jgi:hypothetical protein
METHMEGEGEEETPRSPDAEMGGMASPQLSPSVSLSARSTPQLKIRGMLCGFIRL